MMGPEVRALLDKGDANLKAARMLLEAGHVEIAASRAYYAMFYVAQGLLLHLGQAYSKHAAVIGAFGRDYAKPGTLDAKYHRWLIDGQDLRSLADYGSGTAVERAKAEEACERAEEFMEAARRYLVGMRERGE